MQYSRLNLTKKQMWQKQIKCQNGVGVNDNSSERLGENVDTIKLDEKNEAIKPSRIPRGVSFHPTAFVVLIPTADEYHQAGLGSSLWWAEDDFRNFKQAAMEEIKEFVRLYPNASCGEVLKKYYDTLLSEEETSDDINYPVSPNSVAELTQCLDLATAKNSTEAKFTTPAEANFLFRSSSDRRTACIDRSDSVQLHKLRLDDHELPGVDIDSQFIGDESPLPSPVVHTSDKEDLPPVPPANHGFVGLVPILANAAAMLILSLVQSE